MILNSISILEAEKKRINDECPGKFKRCSLTTIQHTTENKRTGIKMMNHFWDCVYTLSYDINAKGAPGGWNTTALSLVATTKCQPIKILRKREREGIKRILAPATCIYTPKYVTTAGKIRGGKGALTEEKRG